MGADKLRRPKNKNAAKTRFSPTEIRSNNLADMPQYFLNATIMQIQFRRRLRSAQVEIEFDSIAKHSSKMRLNNLFAAIIAGALLVGCQKPATISTPSFPTAAQPKLPSLKLWIGPEELVAEMALSGIQMQTGMMFRTNVADNEGMIFVMPYPQRASFWMKNTSVPLSAAYIDPQGVILEIHDLQPHRTNSVVAGSHNVQYVLETSQGWFERKNIKPGTLIRTERGSLSQTFQK